jgi:hypothetical protein
MSRCHSLHPHSWLIAALVSLAWTGASFAATSTDPDGPKSREQVKAELNAALHDGTFDKMSRNRSYPPELDPAWHSSLRGQQPPVASNLRGTGEINFEAPAAGMRSRQEVQLELQRAREDGSLRQMNANRSY